FSESFTFYTQSDDGIRLWVNHKLLVNNWTSHTLAENSGSIALTAGTKYDIQIEYYNNTGAAAAQLWWSSPSVPKSLVPAARLLPGSQNLRSRIDHAFIFAESQLSRTITALAGKTSTYVHASLSDGTWTTVTPDYWTSGFLPGAMWQIYAHNP